MRKRYCWPALFLFFSAGLEAQQDSIYIDAALSEDRRMLNVSQKIFYINTSEEPLSQIKLLNWNAGYRTRRTPLLKRTLQDRKNELYFAEDNELAQVKNLSVEIANKAVTASSQEENMYLPLEAELQPGESVSLQLNYQVQLPLRKFTGYGTDEEQTYLKYFFIVPDTVEPLYSRHYKNIEENQSPGNYWNFTFDLPPGFFIDGNLERTGNTTLQGNLTEDPEFLITRTEFTPLQFSVNGQNITVQAGYGISEEEKQRLNFLIPLQLDFIRQHIGTLPSKIFLSERFKKQESFVGIDDLHFWKFHYSLFSKAEQTDLNYFSMLSKAVLQETAVFEQEENHWLLNGLKTYLEIQYLQRNYPDRKLLGNLPEQVKIFGMKPLKIFHASRLKLLERYGLAYQYMQTQNLDQAIDTPFSELSNFNATAISHFETGTLFNFLAEKMGTYQFNDFIKGYLKETDGKIADKQKFLDELTLVSGYSADFMDRFVQHKNRVNFKLKRFKKNNDEYLLKIAKNTSMTIPFQVQTQDTAGNKKKYWFDTDDRKRAVEYRIPQSAAEKIILNDDYIFPETNFRDNYRYTTGLFANTKKIRLKILTDVPNPEYNEIYLNPRLNFNAYDKVLLGLNVRNTALFDRRFKYSFTPYFSTGTGKLTGSGSVGYSFQPAEAFFRSLDVGVSASHFHYDYDLTYQKFTAFANLNFAKNPRSDIGRSIQFAYNYLEKDLNPELVLQNEYGKYNLWNIGYAYSDRRLIHERFFSTGLQWMEDFQKISSEFSYRWEYAEDKKILLRWFGGYFFTNKTKNDLFDYGIARVSNYAFSYGLLGQSATSGLLAQQAIIAEGGFKSFVGDKANQWITTVNMDSHVWKWFNVYADAGMYKNRDAGAQFIWDSGVKLKVIPDFLEVYFPIQSSLGFEPGFKDYGKRIRFTLNLNISALTSYFRRGWF